MSKRIFVERAQFNSDALHQSLQTALSAKYICCGSEGKGTIYVELADNADSNDESTARTIVTTHDQNVLTDEQQRKVERKILFEQVNARFIEEVIKDTPDWLTCYNDIVAMVTGQQAVINALNNIIDLTNDVHLLTITAGTNRAKEQQILTFIQVLALWSTVVNSQ